MAIGTALLAASAIGGGIKAISANSAAKKQAKAAETAAKTVADGAQNAANLQTAAYDKAGQLSYDALGTSADALSAASTANLAAREEGEGKALDATLTGLGGARDAIVDAQGKILTGNQATLDQTTALFNPYLESGNNALAAVNYNLGIGEAPEGYKGFEGSQGFQFALKSANDGIEGSAAASGGLMSGATLKALSDNSVGMAQQDFNTYLAQLMQQVQGGQSAAGSIGNALQIKNAADTTANNTIGTANAGYETGVGTATADYSSLIGQLKGENAQSQGVITSNKVLGQADVLGKAATSGANAQAEAAQTAAAALAGGTVQKANAEAAGTVAVGNALNGVISNGANILGTGAGLYGETNGKYGWAW